MNKEDRMNSRKLYSNTNRLQSGDSRRSVRSTKQSIQSNTMKINRQKQNNSCQPFSNKKKRKPNSDMMIITYIFLAIFIGMMGYFIKFQVVDSDEVINNSFNKREDILVKSVTRGNILSDDKQILATTNVDANGNETRSYPFGSIFSHAVGYTTHGEAGVELIASYKLLTSNAPVFERALNDVKGEKNIGDNVVTSLNVNMTKAANEALSNSQGAVIAIEPSTGKILTMVSKPDFDPNTLDADWDKLVSDSKNSNLVNRTTSGMYAPGSTFKLFTLLEFINENSDYENYSYTCKGSINIENNKLRCSNSTAHGSEDLLKSFAKSCNCSFANIGTQLNKTSFKNLCNKLMFNEDLPIAYPSKASSFVLDENSSTFDTMQTSIGQGKTTVSPLHLALIACAIENNGVLMKPYVVTKIENYLGHTIKTYSPEKYDTLFSKEECELLKPYLREVMTSGTGAKLNTDQYTIYGKTGTAQTGDGSTNNSLFMGFAEKDSKKIAIAVVREDVPEGATNATAIARNVMDVYFNGQ